MINRLFALLLAFAMLVCLAACGNEENQKLNEALNEIDEMRENACMLLQQGDLRSARDIFDALRSRETLPELSEDDNAKIQDAALSAQYKIADAFESNGQSGYAAILFGIIKEYSDARERSLALWDTVANREVLACSSNHTVAIRSDGTVMATKEWPSDWFPHSETGEMNDIIAIDAIDSHTLGLRSDGTVIAVGKAAYIEGVEEWTDIVAISCTGSDCIGLRMDGTVVAVGKNDDGCADVGEWTDIVAISSSYYHTLGLRADGTVVATGDNDEGQCNVEAWTDIVAVDATLGWYYSVGLRSDGTIALTYESYDEEALRWTGIVAISAGDGHTVGLRSDGTVLVNEGENDWFNIRPAEQWTDIVAIEAGDDYIVGLRSDGTLVTVGDQTNGELNVGGWTDIMMPK